MHLNSLKKKNQHKNICSTSCLPPLHPDPVAAERLPVPDLWDLSLKEYAQAEVCEQPWGWGTQGFSGLPCLLKSPPTAICTLKAPTTLSKAHPSGDKVLKCKKKKKGRNTPQFQSNYYLNLKSSKVTSFS